MSPRYGPALGRQLTVLLLALATATCHVSDVMAPGVTRDVRLAFVDDDRLVAGRRAVPAVRVTLEGEPLADGRVAFHSSDTTVVGVTPGGDSIVGRRLGTATVTAFLQSSMLPANGPSVSRVVRVVPKSFTIVPGIARITALGDTLSVAAQLTDAQDQPLDPAAVRWSVADTTTARITMRTVTGLRVGETELRAVINGDTARAPVSVAQRLARYRFPSPVVVLDAIGAETTLVAIGQDARGNDIPDAPPPVWETPDTRVSVTAEGRARAVANGVAAVRARRPDGNADTLRVEVNQRAVEVVITPRTTTSISSQFGTIDLLGRGFDRLGNTVTDDLPFWRSLDGRIAVVDSTASTDSIWEAGRTVTVTGISAGTVGIVARQDAAADTVMVTVINDPASIVVTPEAATLASVHDSLKIEHTVRNGEGSIIPDARVERRSTDSTVVRVLDGGWVVAADSGVARVIVQVTNSSGDVFADTSIVSVTDAPASVDVQLTVDTLTFIGDSVLVPVAIFNKRGNPLDRDRVRWIARDVSVATVSAVGNVVSTGTGATWIVADGGVVRDSMRVVVTNDVAAVTIDGVANGVVDTIPLVGQALQYTATARDANGTPLSGYEITWSSTATGIVKVSSTGLATAAGLGAASVIARTAGVADTVRILVRRPTRIHVDNESTASPRFGTLARPLATIAAGLELAREGDSVVVAAGTPYAEAVTLKGNKTLLGDSAAYLASGRDRGRLPIITPPDGARAILLDKGPATVRHLTIRNGVDGTAIASIDADVVISSVHVNPGLGDIRRGAGIFIEKAPTSARIDSVTVESVRGFGVRIVGSVDGRVTRTRVRGVAALAGGVGTGSDGAGITIEGGRGGSIAQSTVRSAGGTQLLLSGTVDASLTANTLAGERQLAVVSDATGLTAVTDNNFELARLTEDAFTGNSTTDGRSGLAVRRSPGVQVERNRFHDGAGATSLMDAIRLSESRAARLTGNVFVGGRRAVRATRSSWEQLRTRVDSVAIAIETVESDTLSITDDTLATASAACLSLRGSHAKLMRVTLAQCGVGDVAAIDVTGGSLVADRLAMSGTNPRAILVDSARVARVRRSIVRGPGAGTIGIGGRAGIELLADSVQLTGSLVTGYPDRAGVYAAGLVVRLDTNAVNRSRTGVILGGASASLVLRDNDLYDADLAALEVTSAVTTADNWWGDGRGPRGTSTATVGDTVHGPAVTSPYRSIPIRSGVAAALLRKLRGDGQSAPVGTTLPLAFSVRVTDADGLPVRSIPVTFALPSTSKCSFSGLLTVNVATNDSGIAEATMTVGRAVGSCTATVTASGASNSLTFTASSY